MKTRLELKVSPGASHPGVAGWLGNALKVRVAVPPEKGRANRAVESMLAATLGVPESCVNIISGHTSQRKLVEVDGLTVAEIRRRLPG